MRPSRSRKKDSVFTPHNIVLHTPEAGIDFNVELSTDPNVIKFTPTELRLFTATVGFSSDRIGKRNGRDPERR
jgi:hypothetical protein